MSRELDLIRERLRAQPNLPRTAWMLASVGMVVGAALQQLLEHGWSPMIPAFLGLASAILQGIFNQHRIMDRADAYQKYLAGKIDNGAHPIGDARRG